MILDTSAEAVSGSTSSKWTASSGPVNTFKSPAVRQKQRVPVQVNLLLGCLCVQNLTGCWWDSMTLQACVLQACTEGLTCKESRGLPRQTCPFLQRPPSQGSHSPANCSVG